MTNNILFNVFHIEELAASRSWVANRSTQICLRSFHCLDSKAIAIQNLKSYNEACLRYPEIKNIKIQPKNSLHTWGQVGIIASTYMACLKFLNTDAKALLIVEDDLIIDEHFPNSVKENIDKLDSNWDLFYQFRTYENPAHDVSKEFEFDARITTLAGYVLNRSGAEKMIRDCKRGINEALDFHYLGTFPLYRRFAIGDMSKMFCKLDEKLSAVSSIAKTEEIAP